MSVANKLAGDALNVVLYLLERVTVAVKGEAELLDSASTALDRILRATVELCQECDTVPTESKELENTAK